ncbi:DUF2065 domain-containing protein [Aliikangiella marina]|uniref:DUF2065 domain-containing protein n=1 Tax=Aliikangiella marina TaxID=1712262 RepID=A0A545T765_9GAMM|nr:DUF2065 domain-containing protein [Aliikangiella marina]TQV73022.1 DUF2065 domain-containing protein [Aliikangiella marina]
MSDLWAAIAIAIILEGIMPFLAPKAWKETVAKIASLPDKSIRGFGLTAMVVGLLFLSLVR